jgi:hypothetical protein
MFLLLQVAQAPGREASRHSGWRLFWQTCRARLTLNSSRRSNQGNETMSSCLASSLPSSHHSSLQYSSSSHHSSSSSSHHSSSSSHSRSRYSSLPYSSRSRMRGM